MAELIWNGKFGEDGKRVAPVRIALPFQTVETVNESAKDRKRTLDLFAAGRISEWRNRLIWGDKKYVLPSLLPEFAGKVNLIYIDPPFDTGSDFSFATEIPEADEVLTKQPSVIEQKAYRDTWGRGGGALDSYLQWFYETAIMLRDLLADNGSLYVHLDDHVSHYAKVVLDEALGVESFQNEIIWRRTGANTSPRRYGRNCDSILFYALGDNWIWNNPRGEYDQAYVESHYSLQERDGRRYQLVSTTGAGATKDDYSWKGIRPPKGRHWAYSKDRMDELAIAGRIVESVHGGPPRVKYYLDDQGGPPLQVLWSDIKVINSQARERTAYATQKPEALLERILTASSNEGDLVLDCFCGSGTTAAVAEKLGRRWIACDLGRFAIQTTRKRMLNIPNVRPFVVQNLGKYERQAWMASEFAHPDDRAARDAGYRSFVLELYRATPVTGFAWLHGVKAGRMVHVGSVDAPITRSDAREIVREVWRAAGGQPGTNASAEILGWDFAFETNEMAKQLAAESHVELHFRRIPTDVLEKRAVEQGDIKPRDFFELRSLSAKVAKKKRSVTVELTDFILPSEDLPDDVAKAVTHWSQWIDYWAIDWNYRSDTFHNEWQSYRTREDPTLELQATNDYREPGTYAIVVKVIDLLGNDTTKLLSVEVK